MKISVIMLTYNRETMVSRMIESVLAQTFKEFEYIIVDNGSSDKSGVIADEYALKDDRIKVIHKEKGNVGSGRNVGISNACGEYITIIDDDDYLEPGYLDYLYNLITKNDADIAICGSWREIDGERQPKYIFDEIYLFDGQNAVIEMLKRKKFNNSPPTKLISRKILQNIVFSETLKWDDLDWTYKIIAATEKIVVSGVPLYTFVRHNENNSKGTVIGESVDIEQIKVYLKIYEERRKWLTLRFPKCHEFWLYAEISYIFSMYEKTEGNPFHVEIEMIMKRYIKTFLRMERFYTERDKMLIEKYGGILNES